MESHIDNPHYNETPYNESICRSPAIRYNGVTKGWDPQMNVAEKFKGKK